MQNLVHIAFRRQQSGAFQPLQHVVFRLLLPFALGSQRRSVLGARRLVFYAVHPDLGKFVVRGSGLQVISPHASLRFKRDLVLGSRREVAFLAVDVSGHPVTRDQIQPPAVHVVVIIVTRSVCISAVQAHNAEVLILNPDSAEKAPASSVFFRRQVKYQAAHVAQELAPRVVEIVVLPVKVVAVGEDHPRKAQRLVLELEPLREPA